MTTRRHAADGFYRHLREWFTAFLPRQRGATGNTITSCRQTWNMLLGYVANYHHVAVEKVTFAMVDRATVTGFLDHIQAAKSWTVSTRNQRLACIRSSSPTRPPPSRRSRSTLPTSPPSPGSTDRPQHR
jgi:hypothetical protein